VIQEFLEGKETMDKEGRFSYAVKGTLKRLSCRS